MADVEYVARVVVERIERRIKPAGSPVASSTRRVTSEDRLLRDKSEVASFTIRSSTLPGVAQRVHGMLQAALPDEGVVGEQVQHRCIHDEEEEADL